MQIVSVFNMFYLTFCFIHNSTYVLGALLKYSVVLLNLLPYENDATNQLRNYSAQPAQVTFKTWKNV